MIPLTAYILLVLAAQDPAAPLRRAAGGLPSDAQRRASAVLADAALIRILPAYEFQTSAAVLEKLFDHPALTASLARAAGLGEFHVAPAPGGAFRVREGREIRALFEEMPLFGGRRIWLIRGEYYGSLFVRLRGSALLLARYEPTARGTCAVNAGAALQVDSAFHGFLVRLLHPLFERLVDARFERYMEIAQRLSEALAADPRGTYNRAWERGELTAVQQELYRKLFL